MNTIGVRPVCQMPNCEVQIPSGYMLCAGHIYLTAKEQKKCDDFAKASLDLLKQARAEEVRIKAVLTDSKTHDGGAL